MTTKTSAARLPPELLFEPDGHVTEATLACVADGEIDLVSQRALDHLDRCEPCAVRLGEAALLSIAAGEALREGPALAPSVVAAPALVPVIAAPPVSPRPRRPLPVAALAAALALAAITAGPALLDAFNGLPSTIAGVISLAPFAARVTVALGRGALGTLGPAALLLKCASALVFMVLGLRIARGARRSRSWQGGVG